MSLSRRQASRWLLLLLQALRLGLSGSVAGMFIGKLERASPLLLLLLLLLLLQALRLGLSGFSAGMSISRSLIEQQASPYCCCCCCCCRRFGLA
jgi:hypothetical protein